MQLRAVFALVVALGLVAVCAVAPGGAATVSPVGCGNAPALHAGESVPAWRLGAVWFTSSASGVGLTDQSIECQGHSAQQTSLRSGAWLAATSDGGTRWVIEGHAIPTEHQQYASGEKLIVIGARVYALAANRVYVTTDGGAVWTQQSAVPSPATDLVIQGGEVLAVSGPAVDGSGRVTVTRSAGKDTGWQTVYRSATSTDLRVELIAASPQVLLLDFEQPAGTSQVASRLLVSENRGGRWSTVTLPRWDGNRCSSEVNDITAARAGTWWVLCVGEGAAGSSPKALLETTDAGHRWTIRSAVPTLSGAVDESAVPRVEPDALVAASASRLYYAGLNGLFSSANGGEKWSAVRGIDQGGADSDFDLLGAHSGWLLAPGIALWQTTNATNWRPTGRVNEP